MVVIQEKTLTKYLYLLFDLGSAALEASSPFGINIITIFISGNGTTEFHTRLFNTNEQ